MTKNEYILYKKLDNLIDKLDEDYGRLTSGNKSKLSSEDYDTFCCLMLDSHECLTKYEKEHSNTAIK